MRKQPIFYQLLVRIIFPVLVVIIGLAIFNIKKSDQQVRESFDTVNKIYSDEIQTFLEFQDRSLHLIENNLDREIRAISYKIINNDKIISDSFPTLNLDELRDDLNLSKDHLDIYVITQNGEIVNSTFTSDIGKNVFSFGRETKQLVNEIFKERSFVAGEFSPEDATKALRKFSYHCTLDGKYIIELGIKSEQANNLINQVKFKLNHLTQRGSTSVLQVDLFIGDDEKAVSFNNRGATISPEHYDIYSDVLRNSRDVTLSNSTLDGYVNSRDTLVVKEGRSLHYQFVYMPRQSDIYENSVVRILSDRTKAIEFRKQNVQLYFLVVLVIILVTVLSLYFISRKIIKPFKVLQSSFDQVALGNLNERTDTFGAREFYLLGKSFNHMVESLKEYCMNLESTKLEAVSHLTEYETKLMVKNDQLDFQKDEALKFKGQLQKAFKRIDDQNSILSESRNYAHIVESIVMPSQNLLREQMKDFFLIYRPKNIVGGDLYWTCEIEGKIIVITADCTGHGLSGAFMSVLTISLLNQIVKEQRIFQPILILEKLRDELYNALLSTEENIDKDEIDIAIIEIDRELTTLKYVGANMPVVFVKNDEFYIEKGNRRTLSGSGEGQVTYEEKIHQYDSGDVIYMFSDGWQDQFGGEENKKFMFKRLQNLISRVYELPLQEQKKVINSTIDNWMMNADQIDDILMLGIRL